MNDVSNVLAEVAAAFRDGGPFNEHAVADWQAAIVETLERRAREIAATAIDGVEPEDEDGEFFE
jgi:hypothetical protein